MRELNGQGSPENILNLRFFVIVLGYSNRLRSFLKHHFKRKAIKKWRKNEQDLLVYICL